MLDVGRPSRRLVHPEVAILAGPPGAGAGVVDKEAVADPVVAILTDPGASVLASTTAPGQAPLSKLRFSSTPEKPVPR